MKNLLISLHINVFIQALTHTHTHSLVSLSDCLAANQNMLQICWGWTEGACWVFFVPLVEVTGRWQDIVRSTQDEADLKCFHAPQLFPGELSLLNSLPFNQLSLFYQEGDLSTPAACNWRRTSSMTSPNWDVVALCHDSLLSPRPWPSLPCCTLPTISLCIKTDFACCDVVAGVYFLPVTRVRAVCATHGSQDLLSVISTRTWVHLNLSSRLDTGSSRIPLPYKPMLLKHQDLATFRQTS